MINNICQLVQSLICPIPFSLFNHCPVESIKKLFSSLLVLAVQTRQVMWSLLVQAGPKRPPSHPLSDSSSPGAGTCAPLFSFIIFAHFHQSAPECQLHKGVIDYLCHNNSVDSDDLRAHYVIGLWMVGLCSEYEICWFCDFATLGVKVRYILGTTTLLWIPWKSMRDLAAWNFHEKQW